MSILKQQHEILADFHVCQFLCDPQNILQARMMPPKPRSSIEISAQVNIKSKPPAHLMSITKLSETALEPEKLNSFSKYQSFLLGQ